MRKNLIVKLTSVIVLSLVFALLNLTVAFACESCIPDEVDKTNAGIEKLIQEAIDDSDHAVLECKNKIDNELKKLEKDSQKQNEVSKNIEKHKTHLEEKLDKIAEELLERTNGKAYGLVKKAAKYDIQIICEYVEVKLADRVYLVDPLRIVGN